MPKKPKDPNAVALGKKGGKARAKKTTPEQRAEWGRKGAAKKWARWGQKQTEPK